MKAYDRASKQNGEAVRAEYVSGNGIYTYGLST